MQEPIQVISTSTSSITYSVKLNTDRSPDCTTQVCNNDLGTSDCSTPVCVTRITAPPTTDPIQVSVIVSNSLRSVPEVIYPTTGEYVINVRFHYSSLIISKGHLFNIV